MVWVEIYDGLYSVSDTGLVKANERIIHTKTGIRKYKERLLKPEKTQDGHLRVTLSKNGVKTRFLVHRLVAENFLPNPNNLPVINHKDENPMNNNVNNLEWCTIQYNNVYNERHKRIGDTEGTNVSVYKEGKLINSFPSITKFANAYNIPISTAWRYINCGKTILGYTVIKEEK